VPRTRTTKKLAQRIDLNYFKRSNPLRRWRTWLAIGLPALAVVWLLWHGVRRDETVYSSGRLSAAHAVLNSDCAACHVRDTGSFSAVATDAACLACHDGPIHKDNQMFTPTCASCHLDHRGPTRLAETSDASCTQCHATLHTKARPPRFENVGAFQTNHPEFAALRRKRTDPGTIKLNHEVHLAPNLRGPDGKPVLMQCSDCHRTAAFTHEPWLYGTVAFRPGGLYSRPWETAGAQLLAAPPALSASGRLMEPVQYEKACAACHLLQFDKRFREGVPHGKNVAEISGSLVKKFREYIAANPAELREVREPDRNLTGKPLLPKLRVLTPAEWVAEKTAEAEELLWRKTCKQCHVVGPRNPFRERTDVINPVVDDARITAQWMPHAKFSHTAHQMLTCTSCHAATTSKETSDVLLPGVATCQSCHSQSASGAESRCFFCHTYHDWSREKPVRGKFRLREITGGRPLGPGEQKVAIE